MRLFHGSIRKKLIVLVLLATSPVFLVLIGTELINRQHAVEEAKKEAALFLSGFAEVQRRVTDSTRTLLRTVASMPGIKKADVTRSRLILSTLLETNPIYTNAILVDPDGNVIAAGKNHEKALNLNFADRKQFKNAIRTKGFASGEFVVGKNTKKSIFPFGMAVLDHNGSPKGAIIIGVSLEHYKALYSKGNYPKGSFIGICDHKGLRLFRHPSTSQIPLGSPIKQKVYEAAQKAGKKGAVMAKTSDNLTRIVVFEPIQLNNEPSPYVYMFMGYDYTQIQDHANTIIYRLILSSFISLLMAIAIAWLVGGSGIAKGLDQLTIATGELGQKKEQVSSGIDYDDGEIGTLARSFDKMVDMLRQRENERTEALEQLSASEQRFRQLIEDVSAISIQGYDEERRVTFWNTASEALYGYSQKEALGKKLEDLIIPKEMRNEVIEAHRQWLQSGKKIPPGELVLTDKEGNDVPVFSSHIMHGTEPRREMFCIDIDLSPLKQSETDKEQLMDRLRQSQKMEAIGTLAGGIAHDFNNILSPILGHSEILLDDEKQSGKEGIQQIYASALRARELVRQILTFSRQERAEYRPARIQEILNEVLKLLRSTIPRNIDISQSINETCSPVHADPIQLHQIIMNLATNAFHAIGDNQGRLHIALDELEIGLKDSQQLGIPPGNVVCLTISDTGIGMAKELQDKIFDPFFTTKKEDKGTGMGLSVVHGIVARMGGSIRVHSIPGMGTEFKIYLPADARDQILDISSNNSPPLSFKGTETILLIDDEEAILSIGKISLEKLGYRVHSISRPVEALSLFAGGPDRFDLVITDMSMPKMSGDRLVTELTRIRPDIPIILCTGFNEKVTPGMADELGIREVLLKPVSLKTLAQTVRQVLDDSAGDTLKKS